jgi:hypothetical protein
LSETSYLPERRRPSSLLRPFAYCVHPSLPPPGVTYPYHPHYPYHLLPASAPTRLTSLIGCVALSCRLPSNDKPPPLLPHASPRTRLSLTSPRARMHLVFSDLSEQTLDHKNTIEPSLDPEIEQCTSVYLHPRRVYPQACCIA